MSAMQIERTGPQVLVQDAGRPGGPLVGIASSGAFDRASHDLANRLVGNAPHAATLEVLLGGLWLRALRSLVVAVTGADVAVTVSGGSRATNQAIPLRSDDVLAIGQPTDGLRSYVAVRGGVDGPRLLGSRSTDVLGGLGPAPLGTGDLVGIADDAGGEPFFEVAHQPPRPQLVEVPVELAVGPHTQDLSDRARVALVSTTWRVDIRCDRVGIRLVPPAGHRAARAERFGGLPGDLSSLPMLPGCVQLPPDGHPVVLGPDAGVTGGYAVVGVIGRTGLDRLAQARPGDLVRLGWQR